MTVTFTHKRETYEAHVFAGSRALLERFLQTHRPDLTILDWLDRDDGEKAAWIGDAEKIAELIESGYHDEVSFLTTHVGQGFVILLSCFGGLPWIMDQDRFAREFEPFDGFEG